MSKIKTTSKVSLKLPSRINLGRRGSHAPRSWLWTQAISSPTAPKRLNTLRIGSPRNCEACLRQPLRRPAPESICENNQPELDMTLHSHPHGTIPEQCHAAKVTPHDIVMTLYDPPFLKNLGIKVEKQLTLVKHAKFSMKSPANTPIRFTE